MKPKRAYLIVDEDGNPILRTLRRHKWEAWLGVGVVDRNLHTEARRNGKRCARVKLVEVAERRHTKRDSGRDGVLK